MQSEMLLFFSTLAKVNVDALLLHSSVGWSRSQTFLWSEDVFMYVKAV